MVSRPDEADFGRFLTAVKGGCPDRVPVAEALIDDNIKAAILGRPVRTLADDVAFWEVAGYDFICLPSGILAPGQTIGSVEQASTEDPASEDTQRDGRWAQEKEGCITSMADLDAYPWPSAAELIPDHLTEVDRYLPHGMGVIVTTGKIFTTAWQLMGFETFCLAIYDQPNLVEALFDRIAQLQFAAFQRICAMEVVGGFWFSDDVAYTEGMIVSPEVIRRYVFPWYSTMVDLIHRVGKIAIYHSDGRLWSVLDDIIACGFDALHPIEPKAMDIVEVRRRTDGELSLIGNIDLHHPLAMGRPEDVRGLVRKRIAALAPAGGYLVGSSNSIPDWVPAENYAAMVEAVFDYGKYPVTID